MDTNFKLVLPIKQSDGKIWSVPVWSAVYYLAGPIRGADDWQADAALRLGVLDPGCFVVCPCRWHKQEGHRLLKHLAAPNGGLKFSRQFLWERHYMSTAVQKGGCLVFWLPAESQTNPRPEDAGPYAQDTYGELGMWRTLASQNRNYGFVVGAEKGFPGLDIIKANLDADFDRRFTVYDSLEATLAAAVETAKRT